jgi:ABC-type phosphate/phosphonate transport system permease subunit
MMLRTQRTLMKLKLTREIIDKIQRDYVISLYTNGMYAAQTVSEGTILKILESFVAVMEDTGNLDTSNNTLNLGTLVKD